MTLKSQRRHHRLRRSRWAHANTPEALRRRSAKNDARREAEAALLPPVPTGPEPLSVWQVIEVRSGSGAVMRTITLYVPAGQARCDQWAAEVDGVRCDAMLTATEVGRMVAKAVLKRPSFADMAEARWYA